MTDNDTLGSSMGKRGKGIEEGRGERDGEENRREVGEEGGEVGEGSRKREGYHAHVIIIIIIIIIVYYYYCIVLFNRFNSWFRITKDSYNDTRG